MTEQTLAARLHAAWRAFKSAPDVTTPQASAPAPVNPCSFDAAMTRLRRRPIEINSIISIGAGRGTDGETFLRYWPNATLLLVEMDGGFENEFKAMAARNPKVRYEICGAAGEDSVGLQLKSDRFGGAVVPAGASVAGDATEVRLQRLDTLARKHGLQPPYFLQFDTHGAESDILTGAEEVLAGTALIMMEVYNFKFRFMDFKNLTFDEMTSHLKSRGFRAADFCNPLFRPHDQVLWQLQMFYRRADEAMFAHTSYAPPKGHT